MKRVASLQEAGWKFIGAAAAAWTISAFLVNELLYRDSVNGKLRELHVATGGVLEPTLVGSLLVLLVFGYVVLVAGRLRLADLGWIREDLAPALITFVGFWALMQVVLAVIAITKGSDVTLHPSWQHPGPGPLIGGVLSQVFGNALAEETAFRGFFLTQLALRANVASRVGSFAVAATSSAVLFAVTHIPNRLLVKNVAIGHLLTDQAELVFAGLLFALVFVLTRNLFTTVGLHALANAPVPTVAAADEVVRGTYLAMLCAFLLVCGLMCRISAEGKVAAAQPQHAADGAARRR